MELNNEINEALLRSREALTLFGNQISNKDIIVFLGETKSGKSTLINSLIGTQLQAYLNEWHDYKIKKVDETAYGPLIRQGTLSETAIPGVYPSNNRNVVYVDAPGIGDTRGVAQDITNSIFVNQIKLARSCKFALVTDVCNIVNDNINRFVNFIESMYDLVPHVALRNSVLLVVTKVGDDYTQTEIQKLLNRQILRSGINMTENVKELIRPFVVHQELIALFKRPTHEGVITTPILVNMEGAVSNCLPLYMNTVQVHFSIADGARLALLEVCQNFVEELQFNDELFLGISEYRNYFTVPHYVFASTDQELEETKTEMNNWKLNLTNAKDRNLLNIKEVIDSINDLIEFDHSTTFYKTLKLLAMLDDIGIIHVAIKTCLIQNYKKSLENIIEKTSNLVNNINDEKRERSLSNIAFNVTAVGTGLASIVALGLTIIGAIGERGRGHALAGGLNVGAAAVSGVGLSMHLHQRRNNVLERRNILRQQQGR